MNDGAVMAGTPTDAHAAAVQLIARAIADRHLVMALTGPRCSGKAAVVEEVIGDLNGLPVSFMRIGNAADSPLSLNRLLAQICGQDNPGNDPDSASRVMQALRARSRGENQTVLVVEQAETLAAPSIRLLHLLTRISDPTLKLVQVLFVGTEAFWRLLHDPGFAVLRAQLAVAAVLPPRAEAAPSPLPRDIPVPRDQAPPVVLVATRAQRPAAVQASAPRRRGRWLSALGMAGAAILAAVVYGRGIGGQRSASLVGLQPTTISPALPQPKPNQLAVVQPALPQPAAPQPVPQPSPPTEAAPLPPPATGASLPAPRSIPPAGPAPRATSAPDLVQALPDISPATRRQLRQSFDTFLRQGRAEVAGLTTAQRDQLFEQYLANYVLQEQSRTSPTQPFAAAPSPSPSQPDPAPAAAPSRGSAAGVGSHRVVIHYKSTSDTARIAAARMSSVLDTAATRTELRPVDSVPRNPAVRYYSAEDREAARRLAATLAAEREQPELAWSVQDFSSFRPLPPPGTLEVWLPSS